jgi:hypothetical protein
MTSTHLPANDREIVVSKYDSLKVLKQTKARVDHDCVCCGHSIPKGEIYYREHIADMFLHSLHAKKYCARCFEKHGDGLLKPGVSANWVHGFERFNLQIFLLRMRGKCDVFPEFLLRCMELGLREDELGMRVRHQVHENALTPAGRGRRGGMRVLWVKPINPR